MSSMDMSPLPEDYPQAINYRSLEELVNNDDLEDIITIKRWCEKLQHFKLEGTESTYELQTLVNGLSYLMSYMFTAADELKEVAERETSAMAEREDQWEEEKQELKEELESLRERITSRADAGESSEAFRDQINSLKEENRALQQLNRDRDRQMADQSDRFEALVARVDALTRERDTLIDYKAQSEDTISELRRRIFAKSEESTNEWETKKLKQRNEQAVTLSRQMQSVVTQNEELRSEVSKVSNALEEATRLIEESSKKISDLKEELQVMQDHEADLTNENAVLREKLEEHTSKTEQLESEVLDSEMGMKKLINQQEQTINDLKDELDLADRELITLRERIANDMSKQKEDELEKLKDELVEATKMARELFGEHAQSKEQTDDPTANLRIRLVQLEHKLRKGLEKNDELQRNHQELEDELVKKDENHANLAAEVERLRDLKFGDARGEVNRLEYQLKQRDNQISKLTNFCTMLQIELGRYAEREDQLSQSDNTSTTKNKQKHVQKKEEELREDSKTTKKDDKTVSVIEDHSEVDESEEASKTSSKTKEKQKKSSIKYSSVSDFEHQAMLVSSLYYEIMKLIEENNEKNRQLGEMEYLLKQRKSVSDMSKAHVQFAYEEIRRLKEQSELEVYEHEHESSSSQEELELSRMENEELKRFQESIRTGGNELERRAEEMARKLISERMQTIRLSRSCTVLRTRLRRVEETSNKLKEKIVKTRSRNDKHIANLQYELDSTCMELAAMQHRVIHSVSLKQFEELSLKYRKILKKELIGTDHIENTAPLIDLKSDTVIGGNNYDTSTEQLMAKNTYLKKIISVLTDQNEFWSKETELLQTENEELKKFMEDIENESDLKSILAAIEHRLLFTIRDQQETVFELQRETRKKQDADELLSKSRLEWANERKRFVHMVVVLQRALQQQRSNNMASFTLEQMEKLKSKIGENLQLEEQAMKKRREAEHVHEQLEAQLMNMASSNRARSVLEDEGMNVQRMEKMLQAAYTNVSLETAKLDKLEKIVAGKDKEIERLKEEIGNLEKENEEYLQAITTINMDQIGKKFVLSELLEKHSREPAENNNVDVSVKDETDYEMDYDSSANSESTSERLVLKTVVHDNTAEFKHKLDQMKQTAEAAIQSYKEQLTQKEAEVASYRELLLVKMNEPAKRITEKEIITKELKVPDEETEIKLKQAVREIARLKEEIDELQASNQDLYKNRQSLLSSARKSAINVSIQTDIIDEVNYKKEKVTSKISKVASKSLSSDTEIPFDIQDERLKYKSEIRHLQDRIRKLTTSNKELMIACKRIKDDAMEQLEAKRREDFSTEAKVYQNAEQLLRKDIEEIRHENQMLKKRLTEKSKIIDELNDGKNQIKKNTEEELQRWNERKKLLERIDNLQKKLKEANDEIANYKDKLEKRDKHLDQIRFEEQSYEKDIQRLHRQLTTIKTERDTAIMNSQQVVIMRDKVATLQEQLHVKDREISRQSNILRKIEKEKHQLNDHLKSLSSTIDTLQKEKDILKATSIPSRSNQEPKVIKETKIIIKDDQSDENIKNSRRQLRLMELKYKECEEKLQVLSDQHASLSEEYSKVAKKLASREERSTGAVAVLGDKLQAKDKEISQLKARIYSLERRLSQ